MVLDGSRLSGIVRQGRAIVAEAHEVSRLLNRARRFTSPNSEAEAYVVEALALHAMLVNRTIKLLREAEEVLGQPPMESFLTPHR